MMKFDFRQMLIDNDRYFAEKEFVEDEESKVIGECAFCGADICEDDVDYLMHDESGLGICAVCLDKCHWG